MPDAPPSVDLLPTVVLEHARTGQPIVVDLRDYLAGKDSRYANWRMLAHGAAMPPPPLPSEGGPDFSADDYSDPKHTEIAGVATTLARGTKSRPRHRKVRRS
ncbi:MAG: hypothetical protein HQ481_20370 [Alphaproteobacteria bacterium]|nr:hypothetical protein [Alphaproteobacteria bacterium]